GRHPGPSSTLPRPFPRPARPAWEHHDPHSRPHSAQILPASRTTLSPSMPSIQNKQRLCRFIWGPSAPHFFCDLPAEGKSKSPPCLAKYARQGWGNLEDGSEVVTANRPRGNAQFIRPHSVSSPATSSARESLCPRASPPEE